MLKSEKDYSDWDWDGTTLTIFHDDDEETEKYTLQELRDSSSGDVFAEFI